MCMREREPFISEYSFKIEFANSKENVFIKYHMFCILWQKKKDKRGFFGLII